MPKELDRMTKTRDKLIELAEIADRDGFEAIREKISSIAEEAGQIVEGSILAEQNLTGQYASA